MIQLHFKEKEGYSLSLDLSVSKKKLISELSQVKSLINFTILELSQQIDPTGKQVDLEDMIKEVESEQEKDEHKTKNN